MIELTVPDNVKPQIVVMRKYFTDDSTVAELSICREFVCHTLEDKCRRLKMPGRTAIPAGIYRVILDFSDRLGFSPLILGVPGFTHIRIHSGNTAAQTEGCLLVGRYDEATPNFVSMSRNTFSVFMPRLAELNKREKLFIQIVGGIPASEFIRAA